MKIIRKMAVALTIVAGFAVVSCSGADHTYGPADPTVGPKVVDNIMTRTSVRHYTGKQIPADTVQLLLRAAMSAPSAVNAQPWKFVVVENAQAREAIGQQLDNVGDKVKTAGAVVVVCGDKNKFFSDQPEYWVQDCSAATENLLIAANAIKLGAVWCGIYPDQERVDKLSQLLQLPSNLVPLNVITIGYPTAVQTPKEKWNPENIIII